MRFYITAAKVAVLWGKNYKRNIGRTGKIEVYRRVFDEEKKMSVTRAGRGQGMKTILITGSTGFLGRNLIEHLKGKCFIDAPTHKFLDLTNEEEVKDYFAHREYHAVIHCAGRDDARCFQDNVKMLVNLKANVKCKILLLGSGADTREDGYGLSKHLALTWATNSPSVSYLRLYGVFGKYERGDRFITTCIKKKIAGEPIEIPKNRIINYIPVEDVCRMVEAWIKSLRFCSLYVPKHPDSMSLTEIASYVGVEYSANLLIENIYEPEEAINPLIKNYTPLRKAIDNLGEHYGLHKRKAGGSKLKAVRKR